MQSNFISTTTKLNRLGFHYYNDVDHFDEASLDFWLPKLQAAGTRWIVLAIPERAEIPENFLLRLSGAGIEPIIDLQLSLSNPPDPEVFRQRTAYYRNAGVHLIHFFSQPNMKTSWSAADWQKPDLIRIFTDTFCSLAEICISNGVIPIFPMLTPGGDYWDVAFLKQVLQILNDEYAQTILPNLIFSANAGFQGHTLDWGKGGPQENPNTTAYGKNQADHRGFYIFEWYQALIKEVLKKTYPLILFQTGQWSADTGAFDAAPKESGQQFFKVLTMIQQNHQTSEPQDCIPPYVIACNLYKLPTDYVMNRQETKGSSKKSLISKIKPQGSSALLPGGKQALVGKTVGTVAGGILLQVLTTILLKELQPYLNEMIGNTFGTLKSWLGILLSGGRISDYFLVPDVVDLLSDDQQQMIKRYLKVSNCKAGRNLNEALASKNVILINDKTLYPQNIINLLHQNECNIRTLSVSKR